MNGYIVGKFENWCEKKFDEYYYSDKRSDKVKAYAFGLLRGVPAGLVVCGIQLYTLGAIGLLTGKRIELVDKK